jgi:hypothetical protein
MKAFGSVAMLFGLFCVLLSNYVSNAIPEVPAPTVSPVEPSASPTESPSTAPTPVNLCKEQTTACRNSDEPYLPGSCVCPFPFKCTNIGTTAVRICQATCNSFFFGQDIGLKCGRGFPDCKCPKGFACGRNRHSGQPSRMCWNKSGRG